MSVVGIALPWALWLLLALVLFAMGWVSAIQSRKRKPPAPIGSWSTSLDADGGIVVRGWIDPDSDAGRALKAAHEPSQFSVSFRAAP